MAANLLATSWRKCWLVIQIDFKAVPTTICDHCGMQVNGNQWAFRQHQKTKRCQASRPRLLEIPSKEYILTKSFYSYVVCGEIGQWNCRTRVKNTGADRVKKTASWLRFKSNIRRISWQEIKVLVWSVFAKFFHRRSGSKTKKPRADHQLSPGLRSLHDYRLIRLGFPESP